MIESLGDSVRQPTHEAFMPEDLFSTGIGWVVVARFKAQGVRVEVGVFLVDVCCLGVKNAFYEATDTLAYRRLILGYYQEHFRMTAIDPVCGRKLVEQAVAYAKGLGLAPHADYKKGARVFGGLRAEECDQSFTFGRNGKPFYCSGPNETRAQAARIVQQLEQRCGRGNFDFLIQVGESGGIEL